MDSPDLSRATDAALSAFLHVEAFGESVEMHPCYQDWTGERWPAPASSHPEEAEPWPCLRSDNAFSPALTALESLVTADGALRVIDELREGQAVKEGHRPEWTPARWGTDFVGRWYGQLDCIDGRVAHVNEWSTRLISFPRAVCEAAVAALWRESPAESRAILSPDPSPHEDA